MFDGADFVGGADDVFVVEVGVEAERGHAGTEVGLERGEVAAGGHEDAGGVEDGAVFLADEPVFDVDAALAEEVADGVDGAGFIGATGGGNEHFAGLGGGCGEGGAGEDADGGIGAEGFGEGLAQGVSSGAVGVLADEGEVEKAADDCLADGVDVAVVVNDDLGDVAQQAGTVGRENGEGVQFHRSRNGFVPEVFRAWWRGVARRG